MSESEPKRELTKGVNETCQAWHERNSMALTKEPADWEVAFYQNSIIDGPKQSLKTIPE